MARIKSRAGNNVIMYGRSAAALANEIRRQGVPCTTEQAEGIIKAVAKKFPRAWKWLLDNMAFAVSHEYIENSYGRRRYFAGASQMSKKVQAAVRREASNSPIQGGVADLLARAGTNLYNLKYKSPHGAKLDFKILLPIHDAFLFEVRKDQVDVMKKVITRCMSDLNCIPGTAYRLGVDIEVMSRWGEKDH